MCVCVSLTRTMRLIDAWWIPGLYRCGRIRRGSPSLHYWLLVALPCCIVPCLSTHTLTHTFSRTRAHTHTHTRTHTLTRPLPTHNHSTHDWLVLFAHKCAAVETQPQPRASTKTKPGQSQTKVKQKQNKRPGNKSKWRGREGERQKPVNRKR